VAFRTKTQRAIVVFPAIAMVVSLGCVSVSQAQNGDAPVAKRSTTTVKRKTTSTTKAPKGAVSQAALTVLARIKVERERPQGYKRDLFRHWTDDDGDSCNTREEVLIAESRTPAQVDAYGCKVIEGDWFSEYDGLLHTNPSDLDIDHFVPLKEAWDSGAWAWSPSQRQRFANDLSDPRALIAVTAGANRSKGDKDPSNWLPKRNEALCAYVTSWVAVKTKWKLSMDQSEWGRVKNILTNNCPSATIAPWGSSGSSSPAPVGSVSPSTAPPSSGAPTGSGGGLRAVTPHQRCKGVEVGQRGQSQGLTYECVNRKKDGTPSAPGYYYWQPVR
jgi:hypothetical protein